jgi:hypothetical protein
VTFPSKHRAQRGTASRLALTFHVAEGWHLQGPDGLRVEASGGSGFEFTFEEVFLPAPTLLPDPAGTGETGWHGTFEGSISFSVSQKASKGKRDVTVRTRYRACGEGACRPEAVLLLSVPVEVA